MTKKIALAVAILSITAASAVAHVTLETGEAHVGGNYKAVLRVPHGCEGKPMILIKVQIPEGVISAKPQPKAGWTIEKIKGPYAKEYDYYETKVSEGVKELIWRGGSLADDEYDEFVMRVYLTTDLPVGKDAVFSGRAGVPRRCCRALDRDSARGKNHRRPGISRPRHQATGKGRMSTGF